MKIFVLGATGYIGFNVAHALRRSGHQVWGVTRSEKHSQILAQGEINPVIGDMREPESYVSTAEKCDVLIHAALEYSKDSAELDIKTVENLLEIASSHIRPKTLIYTSGVWVHGNTKGEEANENVALKPIKTVSWRPGVEQRVLNASNVNGLVIRPGCVYGKQGGLTALWFDDAYNKKQFNVVGDGANRWAMVHVDDLAEAYRLAAERRLDSDVFNVTDSSRYPVRKMVEAVKGVAGYEGDIHYIPTREAIMEIGDMAEALAIDQLVQSEKARRLLGWQSHHDGFIPDVHTYFRSWLAYHEE